jgi:enoyl-CoA hydratase/carnithine racemase
VIVLTGAGDEAFCTGADLGNLGAQFGERPAGDGDPIRGSGPYRLFTAIPRLGKPIIARLAGHAIAGGLGLAVACDLVIAADDVKLGTPEVDVGLWPMIIMAIINRNVPPKQAFKLYYTGRAVSAREGVEMGLITEVVPRAGLDTRVGELAGVIAARSPIGMRMGRDAFFAMAGLPFDDQIALLLGRLRALAATDDAAEGVTAFLEKRTPRFTGH